jgi:hypothetical protein
VIFLAQTVLNVPLRGKNAIRVADSSNANSAGVKTLDLGILAHRDYERIENSPPSCAT